MASDKRQVGKPRPYWSNAIIERRRALNKRQEDALQETNEALSQSALSEFETGKVTPTNVNPDKFFALLHFLEWTVEEFIEATKLELPFITESHTKALEEMNRFETNLDYLAFPVYASASAGDKESEPLNDMVYVSIDKIRAKGANPSNIKCYRVNGDCLISLDATRAHKNVADGDVVAVDTQRGPEIGDLVVAWWGKEEKMIIKRYKIDIEGVVLYPARPGYPSVVLNSENEVKIIGTVIWREG